MIQVNLLPDVKQQYIRVKRLQAFAITASVGLAIASSAIFVLLLGATKLWQPRQISGLSQDISTLSRELKSKPDVDRILTVQSQLKSLPGLHAQKPAAKRLFGFLTQITPSAASISKLNVDFTAHTFEITGSADKLETINKFADTLKFTDFVKDADAAKTKAFKSVVLSSFERDRSGATYRLVLGYDPAIFDSANKDLKLLVPSIITTRSETERPKALFQPPAEPAAPPAAPAAPSTPRRR